MGHRVVFCKHVTQTSYRDDQVEIVTKLSGLIHTEPKHSPWNGRHVLPANVIHDVNKNKSLKTV